MSALDLTALDNRDFTDPCNVPLDDQNMDVSDGDSGSVFLIWTVQSEVETIKIVPGVSPRRYSVFAWRWWLGADFGRR